MEATRLKCTLSLERIGSSGETVSRKTCKDSLLCLGRNEVGDVVVRVCRAQSEETSTYTLRDFAIHKRFLKDGKAGIRLNTQKVHILISNCPPEQLSAFLKSLVVKVGARGSSQGAQRRMIGDVSLEFDDISPLTEKDYRLARKNKGIPDPKPLQVKGQTPRSSGSSSMGLKRRLAEPSDPKLQPPLKRCVTLKQDEHLTSEQQQVIDQVLKGTSLFFTGSAGTGKSFLLKKLIGLLPPETTFVTASTGAAACLIGGTTLHQFAGIGTGQGSLQQCITMATRPSKAEQWKKCQTLIIDEVSMIDSDFFDKLECVARVVRKTKNPFGGIQLVLCGDFFQLPPVKAGDQKYCFQSRGWRKCIERTIELQEIHRQNDGKFIEILQNIRIGRCPPDVHRELRKTYFNNIERNGIRATKLYTHTMDVNEVNLRELNSLRSSARSFTAEDSDPSMKEALNGMCPVPKVLTLKVGAQVMLAKNINVQQGLVNGARGVVSRFASGSGYPVVKLMDGREVTLGLEKWSVRSGSGVIISRKQLPLKLAWAISIHKSQGMTLDCVEISLSKVFEDGQAYVALSRARSLEGLKVLDFDPKCVTAHKDVIEFYRALRSSRKHYIQSKH